MKTLIVGAGEVGSSLQKIVSKYHDTFIRDITPVECKDVEVMHICYPDHDRFIETTKAYIQEYKPKLTIINSSVKVGTTKEVGLDVVYSPVRGRHPNLELEMKVFSKFIGGYDRGKVLKAQTYFEMCEWGVRVSNNPEALEYLKLMSNVHMGLEVAWRQEVGRMMKSFYIEDRDYEDWEASYSIGYLELKQYHLMRSRMKPSPIGGHCIIPCTEILKSQYPSKALDFILESNDKSKEGSLNDIHRKAI